MTKKNILIVIVFLIIIAIVNIIFHFNKNEVTDLSGKFAVKNISDISFIIIEKTHKKIELRKKENSNIWLINDKYEANKKSIKKIIQALSEVKINKPVAKAKIDSVKVLIQKYSKKITAYNNKKEVIKTFYLSDYDNVNNVNYAMLSENDLPYIISIPGLEKNMNRRYSVYPLYWIRPEIFKYKPHEISEIKIKYSNKNKTSYRIEIEKSIPKIFSIKDQKYIENISNKKLSNYLAYFMNVKFSDFNTLSKGKSDSLKNTEPDFTIFVKDIYKTSKKVELYKIKISDNPVNYDFNKLYAIINKEDIVIVKYFDIDLILKDISYFKN